MIEARDAHPVRLVAPQFGISRIGPLGQGHLGIKFDTVSRWYDKADAAPYSRLLAGGDLFDLGAGIFNTASECIEIVFPGYFEAYIIHAGHIGGSQHDAVAVELVPGAQIDPAIRFAADLVQSDLIDVVIGGGRYRYRTRIWI